MNKKPYDEIPLFIDVKTLGSILGISRASTYDLMHEKGFPTLRIGSRLVVPKDKFLEWVDKNVAK